MKIMKNPFILESLESSFSNPPLLRSYAYYVAILSAITFFWWPRGPLADALRTGHAPQTFTVAAITFLLCLLFVSSRCGLEDFANPESTKVRDIVTLTPVRISSLVLGKLAAGVIHTLVLLLLAMPILIATRAVSGFGFPEMWAAVAAAGASAVALRSLGFLFFVVIDARPTVRSMVLFFVGLTFVLSPLGFFPAASPVSVMLPEPAGAGVFGATIPAYAISAIISVLAAGIFSAASIVWLRFMRRRHASRPVPPAPVKRRLFEE
jgi:hypothetical protein